MAARVPTTSSGKKTSSGTEDQKADANMSGCFSHSEFHLAPLLTQGLETHLGGHYGS